MMALYVMEFSEVDINMTTLHVIEKEYIRKKL